MLFRRFRTRPKVEVWANDFLLSETKTLEIYRHWLKRGVQYGLITITWFSVGTIWLILEVFRGEFIDYELLAAFFWLLGMIYLVSCLSFIRTRLHIIERQFNQYENRYQFRHEAYCSRHVHCLILHYFHSPSKSKQVSHENKL